MKREFVEGLTVGVFDREGVGDNGGGRVGTIGAELRGRDGVRTDANCGFEVGSSGD